MFYLDCSKIFGSNPFSGQKICGENIEPPCVNRAALSTSLEEALSTGLEVADALTRVLDETSASGAIPLLASFARGLFFFAGHTLTSLYTEMSPPRVLQSALPLGVETEMIMSQGKDGTDFWLRRKGQLPKFLWRPQDLQRLPCRPVEGAHIILYDEGVPTETARRCEVLPGGVVLRDLDTGETLAMPGDTSVWTLPLEAAGVAAHAVRCRLASWAEETSLQGLKGALLYVVARSRVADCVLIDVEVYDPDNRTRRPLWNCWKVIRGAVCHVASPSDVFVHDDAAYARLLEHMRDAYLSTTGNMDVVSKVRVGDACAVQGLDLEWRRGEVRMWHGDVATVFLIDTGENVKTTSYRLRPLRPWDALLPPMARRLRLAGVFSRPGGDTTDALKVLLPRGTRCEARRMDDSDGIILQPLETSISVNLQMVRAGVAELLSPGVATPPSNLAEGEVTHAESTSTIYVVFGDRSPLASLELYINSHEHPKTTNLTPKRLVLARYGDDRRWFRACLLDKCRLRFLDYGNVDSYDEADVADVDPEFLRLPFQAVECSLAAWPPNGLSPSQISEAEDVFLSLLQGSEMKARIADGDATPIRVTLTDVRGHDVRDALQTALS